LIRVVRYGMGSAGRYFAFSTMLPDRAGELYRLSGVISRSGANVIGVEHRREGVANRLLGDVEISMQLETRGHEHIQSVIGQLEEAGYLVQTLKIS